MSGRYFCWGTSERTATRWHIVETSEGNGPPGTFAQALCGAEHTSTLDNQVTFAARPYDAEVCRTCLSREEGT